VTPRNVFLTGGTGYMGSRLIPLLLARGHKIRALTRKGSESKLPAGCEIVIGNALEKDSFAAQVQPSDTFVQLVGVAHPSPSKGEQFAPSISFPSAPPSPPLSKHGFSISFT
jgi:uncharacterized protein YbjT (DUF2867 family)